MQIDSYHPHQDHGLLWVPLFAYAQPLPNPTCESETYEKITWSKENTRKGFSLAKQAHDHNFSTSPWARWKTCPMSQPLLPRPICAVSSNDWSGSNQLPDPRLPHRAKLCLNSKWARCRSGSKLMQINHTVTTRGQCQMGASYLPQLPPLLCVTYHW